MDGFAYIIRIIMRVYQLQYNHHTQHNMPGLLQCSNLSEQWCILKLVEAILAGVLMCVCLVEIVITIRMQGALLLNTKFFIHFFIFFSLLFNLAHCIDGSDNLSIFLFLHLFFTNLFLLTVFYYVGDNILTGSLVRLALHIFYAAMIIFYLAIMVIREVNKNNCIELKEIYLVMDCVSVFISLLIFLLYCIKSTEERKMRLFYTETLVNVSSSSGSNYSQPFCRMWVLISANLVCGVVNMIQTTYLYSHGTCKFSENINVNTFINFLFMLFDYYLGSIVALLVLRKIRISQTQNQIIQVERSQSFSNEIQEANKLELIGNMSSRSSAM